QAALVELGLPVSMTLDYLPGREWQGEVDYIYPSLDNKSRTLRVRLRFDNADGLLKPNMYAQVVIQVALDAPVLAVPRDAVIRTGNQNRLVLALGEGYYKSIAVDLGRVTQEYVEILNGVEEGEAVVTSAQFLLDSESSKTSDFKRLHHGDSDTEISAESNVVTNDGNTNSHDDNMSDMVGDEDAETVWVEAEIKSVTPETRVLSAEHEPVPQWQWPSMTMNFFVAEEVDFNQLQAGTQLHMQIGMRADGQYEISAVHIMSQPPFNDQPSMDAEGSLPAEGSEMTDHSQHQMMHNE
ncbi:MAG: efflux RND transporter periplasmic adaptor subunit, partial [Proteobacteria bacterium]|nr:efflux RND transporter periplasmic adaptor subunit [Pseudomonadota bacterium]